jgi:hypothetical protein
MNRVLAVAALALFSLPATLAQLPTAPVTELTTGTCVNVQSFMAAAQAGVVTILVNGKPTTIQVNSLELLPAAVLVHEGPNGTVTETPATDQGSIWNLQGSIVGDFTSKVRLTVSQIGLDGTILTAGAADDIEPKSEALASAPAELRCSSAVAAPVPEITTGGIGIESTSTVRTLVMLDSYIYGGFSCH